MKKNEIIAKIEAALKSKPAPVKLPTSEEFNSLYSDQRLALFNSLGADQRLALFDSLYAYQRRALFDSLDADQLAGWLKQIKAE